MDIFSVTCYLEMNVETFIELKWVFLSLFVLSEMDIFAVTRYLEMNIQTFFRVEIHIFELMYVA